MWVLGSSPKAVEAAVKILLAVPSCTWVSRPITASHGACAAGAVTGAGAVRAAGGLAMGKGCGTAAARVGRS